MAQPTSGEMRGPPASQPNEAFPRAGISIFQDDSAKPGGFAPPPLYAERLVHASTQLVRLIGNQCVYDPRPLGQKEEGITALPRSE